MSRQLTRRVPTRRVPAPRRPAPGSRAPRRLPDRRLRVATGVLMLVVGLLAARLVQVQGIEGPHFARLAQEQRLRQITLTALRAPIFDRSGHLLAQSVDARDVYADPNTVRAAGSTIQVPAMAAELAPLLGVSAAILAQRLDELGHFVYLARGVTPAAGRAVTALNLPGIGVLDSSRRIYPDGPIAASVLGFVGVDGVGLAGLEYLDDRLLRGHDGSQLVETGADGRIIPAGEDVLVPAQPGTSLELTIDRDIQWEAQRAIAAQVKRIGASSGSVIVMDPRTGQILALATAPGFDPNAPTAVPGADLGDPAVSEVYEPGSVNKVITMSAALEQGVATPLSPVIVPPTITVAGQVFHDAEPHGVEHLTLTGVLAESSNIGTIETAQKLGPATLYRYLRAYGYGSPTGVGLPGESGGLLPALDAWSGTTLPTVAFGQGVSVTAMQVASVYATVANGGVRVTPTILKGTVSATGQFVPAPPPTRVRVISAAVAREMSDMLEAVTTEQGTAPEAQIPGYRVAGKTGTADRANGHGGYSGYTASFVGFAPANDPQLVVEVVLQQPINGHFGGTVAAPIFHDIMSFALESLRIPPTGTTRPVVRLTFP
ncbi:MAG TPA: penicillin-binding protein 2 [Mycobacteriales bacterium]|nr:penicillin-binding protein 2 [Mycobacteriales bacterium]